MTGIYAPGRPGGWSNFLPHSRWKRPGEGWRVQVEVDRKLHFPFYNTSFLFVPLLP